MSRMQAGLILAGQTPDFLGTIGRANEMANRKNQFDRQNALAQLYEQHGAGIASGNQESLNALAATDPMAALNVQKQHLGMDATRQGMQINAQELELRKQDAARKSQQWAMGLSAQEAAAKSERIKSGLMSAGAAFQAGNLGEINRILTSVGEQPLQSLDQFPYIAAQYEGVLSALESANKFGQPQVADTEAERELQRLQSIGVDRDTAIKIKEGVLKLKISPVDGSYEVVDLSTGQPVQTGAATSATQTPEQGAPQQALTYSDAYPAAESAFGLQGMATRGANAITDFVAGTPAFPEAQQTQSDFAVLREQLVNDISSGYKRQPPSWLLKNIQNLTPEAGGFEGSGSAQSKLNALGRSIQNELSRNRQKLAARMKPQDRQLVQEQIAALENALGRIDQALGAFGGGQGENTTSSGVKWKVVD